VYLVPFIDKQGFDLLLQVTGYPTQRRLVLFFMFVCGTLPLSTPKSQPKGKKVFFIVYCYVLFVVLVKLIFMLQPLILKLYDGNFLHIPRIFSVVAPIACPPPVKNAGIMHDYGYCLKPLDYSSLLGIEVQHKKAHVLKLWDIVYARKGPIVLRVQGVLVQLWNVLDWTKCVHMWYLCNLCVMGKNVAESSVQNIPCQHCHVK